MTSIPKIHHNETHPQWDKKKSGFYETWVLKLNLAGSITKPGPALWLRFHTLSLKTGLKKVAETWAIFFEPHAGGSRKVAIKNTSSMGALELGRDRPVQIEDSILTGSHSSGCVANRGHKITWDLDFKPVSALSENVNLRFSGIFEVDGIQYDCEGASGSLGHLWGKNLAQDWAWAHCNHFEGDDSTVIELLSSRLKLGGPLVSPPVTRLLLHFQGERIEFGRLRDSLSIRSQYSLTQWHFAADRGPLRVVGEVQCDVKDLVALTLENTDGGVIYCNNSELGSMNLSLYHGGKLQKTLRSRHTTGFETASSRKSPYVELAV